MRIIFVLMATRDKIVALLKTWSIHLTFLVVLCMINSKYAYNVSALNIHARNHRTWETSFCKTLSSLVLKFLRAVNCPPVDNVFNAISIWYIILMPFREMFYKRQILSMGKITAKQFCSLLRFSLLHFVGKSRENTQHARNISRIGTTCTILSSGFEVFASRLTSLLLGNFRVTRN